jgi:hypothetical protein
MSKSILHKKIVVQSPLVINLQVFVGVTIYFLCWQQLERAGCLANCCYFFAKQASD